MWIGAKGVLAPYLLVFDILSVGSKQSVISNSSNRRIFSGGAPRVIEKRGKRRVLPLIAK
jgi:hypothetical protein